MAELEDLNTIAVDDTMIWYDTLSAKTVSIIAGLKENIELILLICRDYHKKGAINQPMCED